MGMASHSDAPSFRTMVITLGKKERYNWISNIIKVIQVSGPQLPLMIVEIQLHRSFLSNVITMVLKVDASLWRGHAYSLVCSTFRPNFSFHYV